MRNEEFCMKHQRRRSFTVAAIVLAVGTLFSCATVHVHHLQEPPPTAKLRVYVEAFTLGPSHWSWSVPHDQHAKNQIIRTGKFLEKKGIYEVVSTDDVKAVVGDQVLSYDLMKSNGWENARVIGKALHADYVLVTARNKSNVGTGEWTFIFTTEIVNVETGAAFRSQISVNNIIASDHEFATKLMRESYRDLFTQAKYDMMAVAVRKGRVYAPPAATTPAKVQEAALIAKPAGPAAPMPAATAPEIAQPAAKRGALEPKKETLSVAAKAAAPIPEIPGAGLFEEPKRDPGAKKLVVYDLDSNEQYRTVALILTEALREEVFKLKQFVLVNREDLQKVLEEMALQQTGLIDEKQAVKTGKGLAANQVVTGQLGLLGKTLVMQAKRVDVETFTTLSLVSTKFTEGQEDEVLKKLPDFVRTLAGQQK
jgi:hypothetical protein